MHKILYTLLCILISIPSFAATEVATRYVPNAKEVGSGRLSLAFWDIYNATLYAPQGTWNAAQPFALTIEYKRTIDGLDIADRSAEEIRKLGFTNEVKLAAWHSQMRSFFPDVTPGDTLTGIYMPDKSTVFYNNDQRIGTVQDTEFGQWFFDIWLSEKTPEPSLRAALLGQE